jgi:hypothetical protein
MSLRVIAMLPNCDFDEGKHTKGYMAMHRH